VLVVIVLFMFLRGESDTLIPARGFAAVAADHVLGIVSAGLQLDTCH